LGRQFHEGFKAKPGFPEAVKTDKAGCGIGTPAPQASAGRDSFHQLDARPGWNSTVIPQQFSGADTEVTLSPGNRYAGGGERNGFGGGEGYRVGQADGMEYRFDVVVAVPAAAQDAQE
jgi:hypothetical protein